MPIQSAKEDFSKDEVLEILRRNVALYKDEQEFIEYIVELATYLIDRHYGKGELSEGGMPRPPGQRSPTPAPAQKPADPGLRSADLPPRLSDLRGRKTDSGRFIPPPPPAPPEGSATPPPPPAKASESSDVDMPAEPPSGKYQSLTPPPAPEKEAGQPPEEPPRTMVNVSSLGKARVYKVVRPYRVSTAAQVPCPVCGAQVPIGDRQCPSCGHVL